MRAVFSAVDQLHGSRLFPLLRIMSCFLGEERPNQKTVAAAALPGRTGGIRSSPRSNAKGRHQVVEFIADTKLIGNKMGCRRVSVPNADDAAGRRIVGVMGVAPHVLQMPQAFGSAHATALHMTQAIAACGLCTPTDPARAVCPSEKPRGCPQRGEAGSHGTAWLGSGRRSGILEKLRF